MSDAIISQLSRRADYTHRQNLKSGRHGWIRLTPAYSLKIVEELIEKFDRPIRVLDPFCGTATTALTAAYYGHEAVTTDINPFLVWLGQAKTAHYTREQIASVSRACSAVVALVTMNGIMPVDAPPLHNIERWWNVGELRSLRVLRAAIEASTEANSVERTLLLVAFCRTLIVLSNAAFNHQSISFKVNNQETMQLNSNIGDIFRNDVSFVLSGAAENPSGFASVLLSDARNLPAMGKGHFDCVITSPPYANRMSYIRELRPYMYWLEFLTNGREAGELDWSAIGGTWGIATSRLLDWKREAGHFGNPRLNGALKSIEDKNNKSGRILANYVAKYFDDMWSHFQRLPLVLSPGAEVHYIVGNSSFYGVLLPVEQIYATMLRQSGFVDIECRPIRKRNSKKELVEFDVTAKLSVR